MAVRFVKPIQTPYESQFVAMPLEFMYKSLQEKQKGLDTTNTLLSSSSLDLKGAIWDEQQGRVADKKREYLAAVEKLTAELAADKNQFNRISQKLAALNRQYQNDAEVQRILKQKELADLNIVPSMGKPNAASLYYRGVTKYNPQTDEYEFKQGPEINYADIVAPIEDKTVPHVMDKFGQYLNASVEEEFKGKYVVDKDPTTGAYILKTPAGEKVEDLNLDNDFTKKAIDNYAKILMNEETDQAHYIKEFLRSPTTGKRGLKSEEELKQFITGVVSPRFYKKTDVTPSQYQVISTPKDKTTSSGGDDVTGDFLFAISPLPTNINNAGTYLDLKDVKTQITQQQVAQVDAFNKLSLNTVQEIDKVAPELGLTQQVKDVYAKTGDPVRASIEASSIILNNYNKLDPALQAKVNPSIIQLTSDLQNITLMEQKKMIYDFTSGYVERKISEESIPEKARKEFANIAKKGTVMGVINVDGTEVPITLKRDLTGEEVDELTSLVALRKTAKGGLFEIFAGKEDYTESNLDKRIAAIIGVDPALYSAAGFDLEENIGAFENSPLEILYDQVDGDKVNKVLSNGIKLDANAISLGTTGALDTEVENFIESQNLKLKNQTITSIALTAGFSTVEDFLKGATSIDKDIDVTKDKFMGVEIVESSSGPPSALYSFGTDGKVKAQVLAPFITKNNIGQLAKVAREMYVKGKNEGATDKEEAGARLYAHTAMSEIDYASYLLLMRTNVSPGDKLTQNFLGDPNFTVTKQAAPGGQQQYLVNIPGAAYPAPYTNPNQVTTIIGLYLLGKEARSYGGLGGTTNSMGKPQANVKVQ